MTANFFFTAPFINETRIIAPSFFSGDSSTTTFPVTNSSIYDIASTIQYSSIQLYQYSGGFTKDIVNSEVTLSDTPAMGAQGIIPGNPALTFSSYDEVDVEGIDSPANVDEQYFYWGDTDEIQLYGYKPRKNDWAIPISFVDAITSDGVDLSFVQLACCDYTGSIISWAATAEPLYTPALDQFGTLSASSASNTFTLACDAASTFISGDYINFNRGQANEEIVRFQSTTDDVMTFTTAFNFDHYIDEPIFACVRQFKAKQTTPVGLTGGEAANLLGLYLMAEATQYRKY